MTTIRWLTAESVRIPAALEMWRLGDVVIDVRPVEDYRRGHVSGAIRVAAEALPGAVDDLPQGQVIVTCRQGKSSPLAAGIIAASGRNALWLAGGVEAWAARGLPVTRGLDPGVRDERPPRWWRRPRAVRAAR